jgi:hypothetical protein
MKAIMTLAMALLCGSASAQYPMARPPFFNNWQYQQQLQWERDMQMRQQLAWERANPERSSVIEFAEQATRVRANKAIERYYNNLNEQMENERRRPDETMFRNPFLHNPFFDR